MIDLLNRMSSSRSAKRVLRDAWISVSGDAMAGSSDSPRLSNTSPTMLGKYGARREDRNQ